MLRTARTVIVDEIHAVIGTRRGAHLALSLERLRQVCDGPLLRLGLSATQKPLDEVAKFLVGGRPPEPCTVVDEGHRRAMDLGVELPRSSLDAVMAHEVWEEYYDRLDRADRRAPHDAGVRQHQADGGAAGAAPQRPPGRRGGHRPPWQPLERKAPRRRNTVEVRGAAGARRHRVAGAGHRHRPRRSRLPDWLTAPYRHAAAAGRPLGPHRHRHAEGAAVPGHP